MGGAMQSKSKEAEANEATTSPVKLQPPALDGRGSSGEAANGKNGSESAKKKEPALPLSDSGTVDAVPVQEPASSETFQPPTVPATEAPPLPDQQPVAQPLLGDPPSHLHEIEVEIQRLHCGLNLRQTLEKAARIGELLEEAKQCLPWGEWLPWLKQFPIQKRSAQIYMQCATAKTQLPALFDKSNHLGIEKFLGIVRAVKRIERGEDRLQAPMR